MSLITLLFSFYAQAGQRSPGLPGLKNIEEKVEFYKANFGDTESNLIGLISDFENAYNTNSIKNISLNQKVFCILYDFYLDSDRAMAFYLRENSPNVICKNE